MFNMALGPWVGLARRLLIYRPIVVIVVIAN